MMDAAPIANYLGLLALVSYIITLLPTIIRVVFPSTRKSNIPTHLLKYRRQIGLLSFCLALAHAYFLIIKRRFDFEDMHTYFEYIQGLSTFSIFTLLAITSNDWSVKRLKKNWKRLHQLTYLAMFILTWHVWDKMSGHWTYVTPLGIMAMIVIIVLFGLRRWKEHIQHKEKDAKQKAKLLAKTTA